MEIKDLITTAKYRVEDAAGALADITPLLDEIDAGLDDGALFEVFDEISDFISEAQSEISRLDAVCNKMRNQLS